jgi:hypothetical protein
MQNTPITNSDTLQAWLETRPQADSIAIAHRSALRVLPESYAQLELFKEGEFELLLVQFMRVMLLSAISPETPPPKFRNIAGEAANQVIQAAKETPVADTAYYIGHSIAIYGIQSAATYATIIAAAYISRQSVASTAAIKSTDVKRETVMHWPRHPLMANYRPGAPPQWPAIRADATALQTGTDPFTLPLWHGETPPEWFSANTTAMRTYWQTENPTHWAFWLRWYDAAIAGRPLDWQLQHAIALIPDDIWQSGPAPVAEAIAKIEAEHKQSTSTTPQTDTLTTANERTRSIKFVIKQVALLHDLIEDEFEHLRGHNGASATDQPLRDQQKATLQKLRDLVNAMLTALDSDPSPATALTVVNEIVPVVVTEAEMLTDKGVKPEVSAEIISMAATIKVLTESGAPGDLATKIAFANSSRNWFWSMFPKWRKGKN